MPSPEYPEPVTIRMSSAEIGALKGEYLIFAAITVLCVLGGVALNMWYEGMFVSAMLPALLFGLISWKNRREWKTAQKTHFLVDSTGICRMQRNRETLVRWKDVADIEFKGKREQKAQLNSTLALLDNAGKVLLEIPLTSLTRYGKEMVVLVQRALPDIWDKRSEAVFNRVTPFKGGTGEGFKEIALTEKQLVIRRTFGRDLTIPLSSIRRIEWLHNGFENPQRAGVIINYDEGEFVVPEYNKNLHFFLYSLQKIPQLTEVVAPFLNHPRGAELDQLRMTYASKRSNIIFPLILSGIVVFGLGAGIVLTLAGRWLADDFGIETTATVEEKRDAPRLRIAYPTEDSETPTETNVRVKSHFYRKVEVGTKFQLQYLSGIQGHPSFPQQAPLTAWNLILFFFVFPLLLCLFVYFAGYTVVVLERRKSQIASLEVELSRELENARKSDETDASNVTETHGDSVNETAIRDRDAGKVCTTWAVVSENVIGLVLILGPVFGGLALLFLGNGVQMKAVGSVLFVLGVGYGIIAENINYLWLHQRARRAFTARSDLLVSPYDPEAFFVEVVPRVNWGQLQAETAADFGFLKVDKGNKKVFFEGDNQRYSIPVEAITNYQIEYDKPGTSGNPMVVIAANKAEKTWEAPFGFRGWLNKKKHEELLKALRTAMHSGEDAYPL